MFKQSIRLQQWQRFLRRSRTFSDCALVQFQTAKHPRMACRHLLTGTPDNHKDLKHVLMAQAVAKNFTMLLAGVVVNAIVSSVVQNIPFAVLSDILPPEQLG